jgi:hypothetical protein
MATGAAFRVYIGQEKKKHVSRIRPMEKDPMENPSRLKKAQKSLLNDAGKSIARSIELASPEFAVVQVDARGLQNFRLPPQKNGGFRACGKDTHHRDSASGDGANSARGLAKGVSEHLEGGIWGASEEGKQLQRTCNWRGGGIGGFC